MRPIIVNTHPDCVDEIIVGHTARLAAIELGLTEVPVRFVHLDPERAHAAALADNKLGEISAWDDTLLGEIIRSGELGRPLFQLSGFTPFEIDRLGRPPSASEDDVPARPKRPLTRVGDIWLLGRHRVICGDCTVAGVVAAVLAGAVPGLMDTDPPYGVNYDPMWREEKNIAATKHKNTVVNDHRASWIEAYRLFPGDVCYVWHGGLQSPVVFRELTSSEMTPPFEMRAHIIWNKPQIVMSRGAYHWKHESCWYGVRKGRNAAWIGDRKQSTVWDIAVKAGWKGRVEENEDSFETAHGTQKPVECMARPMRNHQGDAYDPFLGSGTTVIAAEQLERTCYGVEIDPANVDVIVERWQAFTGGKAVREGQSAPPAPAKKKRKAA